MLTQTARPQTFEQVAGQRIPKALLLSVVKNVERSPRSIILSGSFGTGKCVLPDTRVACDTGYRKISDLCSLDLNGQKENFTEFNCDVMTRDGVRRTSHFYKGAECDVEILSLENGDEVNGTPNHKVLAYHNGVLDLWKVGELNEEDYIAFYNRLLIS